MKRMIGIVVTAVLLAGASAALAGVSAPVKTTFMIKIGVTGHRIDMGDKYVYGAPLGETITWTCDWPFSVLFELNAPLDMLPREGKELKMKGRPDAVPNRCYEYVVAVYKDGEVLILDPVIIFYPPEKDRNG